MKKVKKGKTKVEDDDLIKVDFSPQRSDDEDDK